MATVTVEGEQFKTYPQTYNTQLEAEEALAQIIVKKLGILSGSDGSAIPETQDTGLYADRVVQLIGERHNGVWSTQIEKQYQDKYNENCPASGSKRLKQPTESELTAPFLGLVEHCFPRILDKD